MMEFHISRAARERYQFSQALFSFNGNVVFADLDACRAFAHRMNQVRDAAKNPDRAVHAGQLFAMGLIDEASHLVMAQYRKQFDPEVMTAAVDWFAGQVGTENFAKLLLTFVEHFPGQSVMRGEESPKHWLAGSTDGMSHREAALEELLLLWTANRNEAFKPFEELFEEKSLAEKTVYRQVTRDLPTYFATRPLVPVKGAKPVNLIELLRAPATGAPGSLSEQLALIRRLWAPLLGESIERFLQIAGEILHEEEQAIWMQFNPDAVRVREAAEEAARRRRERGEQQWPSHVSESHVPVFGDPAHEYEKFSPDTAWMPSTVLLAKSTYVWLAQLSRQYGRQISRLDEIPNEELGLMAHRGMNTLWLIGIWERSRASKTIKQLCGNSDAVASAYSLYDYRISEDLGGEGAYINLRDRAYHHGVRLASDMVPNHMGIDSPWVVEHPEWFISRAQSPYPAYRFDGPDLSSDPRVEIKIDDHYYEQTDAAVVFQRRDRATGDTRYVYHGNDGTSFPWNDTAQLDYLNPEVREQVIQTILHVARLFPVIRFDAAMTLAKRHFHRLWFPGPGSSGAIPSRAEYGMSDAEFNRIMPEEFWREVVDRVAAEVPGTLLLAEAFWLMEGYFVRTLGMHRVYNSAFMNMLRDEKNAEYRSVLKNTLEFDPDIMKRYVNFMSNPDERTAIDQFGTGDKCFGVAVMMSTLPGLPMFGHGQIEGFTEKYGMEYQRPRYEENANPWLVERHDREIAPLLKRRWLFAESSNFLLYDFFDPSGSVDENVFAYSNKTGSESAVVVYNNRYGATRGMIDFSAAYADKGSAQLRRQRLSEGLGVTGDPGVILAFRDSLTGLEYLRRANHIAEHGLALDLHAYQSYVFLNWRELRSSAEYPWDRLCDSLNGRGVASLDDALIGLELQPLHDALRSLLDGEVVRQLAEFAEHQNGSTVTVRKTALERKEFADAAWARAEAFLRVAIDSYHMRFAPAHQRSSEAAETQGLLSIFRERLVAALRIPLVEAFLPKPWPAAARRVLPTASPERTATALWAPVFAWVMLELLAEALDKEHPRATAIELFDRLRLRETLGHAFGALGMEGEDNWRAAARVKALLVVRAQKERTMVEAPRVAEAELPAKAALATDGKVAKAEREVPKAPAAIALPKPEPLIATELWHDPDVRWLAGVHAAEGHEYLVREPYEELLWWLQIPALLRLAGTASPDRAAAPVIRDKVQTALDAAAAAGYRLDRLTGNAEEARAETGDPAAVQVPEDEPVEKAAGAKEGTKEPVERTGGVTKAPVPSKK
ncbi:MAG TPA: alpha-amylase family glycosyl hydrolase [Terracidiphilus sp.]|jgi:glycosidase|nr:alpha-amylase family glycosyl hydrolase [Terracidiphilus sp.]